MSIRSFPMNNVIRLLHYLLWSCEPRNNTTGYTDRIPRNMLHYHGQNDLEVMDPFPRSLSDYTWCICSWLGAVGSANGKNV